MRIDATFPAMEHCFSLPFLPSPFSSFSYHSSFSSISLASLCVSSLCQSPLATSSQGFPGLFYQVWAEPGRQNFSSAFALKIIFPLHCALCWLCDLPVWYFSDEKWQYVFKMTQELPVWCTGPTLSHLQPWKKVIIQCVSKNILDIFSCNSRKRYQIFMMFGIIVTEKVSNQ